MQKRTLKQKCLAWLLSLAVAVTFIPLTAGFAFADDDSVVDQAGEATVEAADESSDPLSYDYLINLDKANSGQAADNEVKVYVNFKAPWQDGDAIVRANAYTGNPMVPEVENLNCKWAGTHLPDEVDSNGKPYVIIETAGDWKEIGEYTFTVKANNEAAPLVVKDKQGVERTCKFVGEYNLTLKIVDGKYDLGLSTVTFSEGTVNKKTGYIEVPYDGKLHQLVPSEVKDSEGAVINENYYEVDYPNSTQNAYRKVGEFDIVISAKKDNEGGYIGKITKVVSITDFVTDITIYSQNGINGAKTQKKVYKYAAWSNYSKSTKLNYGYNGTLYESENYIPIETLFSDAGVGEAGSFNDKDEIELWANSNPEKYNNPKADFHLSNLRTFSYTSDGDSIIDDVFAGEFSIPFFLILDTQNVSAAPMSGVGYKGTSGDDYPAGAYFCKPVSEVVLISMDIAGLNTSVAGATYNGKAQTPAVTVKDGDVAVPVTVSYSNNTNAGTGKVTITAKEDSDYYGTVTKTFAIAKAANPLAVSAKTVKIKKKVVKKKAQKLDVSKVMTVSNAQGTVTYKGAGVNKKSKKALKINANTGQITVKKKTKKGTYKMKVDVTAAGNGNYNAATKTVTVQIKVK